MMIMGDVGWLGDELIGESDVWWMWVVAVLVAVAMGVAHPVGWRVIGRELIALSKLKTSGVLAFCLLLFVVPVMRKDNCCC